MVIALIVVLGLVTLFIPARSRGELRPLERGYLALTPVPVIVTLLPTRSGVAIVVGLTGSALVSLAGVVPAGRRGLAGDGLDRRLFAGTLLAAMPLLLAGILWLLFTAARG